MTKRKLLRDRPHNKHRWNVRKWRGKHEGKKYKKVGDTWKWV